MFSKQAKGELRMSTELETSEFDFNQEKFMRCNEVVADLRDRKNFSWIQVLYINRNTVEENEINDKNFENNFPEIADEDHKDIPDVSSTEWKAFVKYKQRLCEQCKHTTIPDVESLKGARDKKIPIERRSAWQVYKSSLVKFTEYAKMNMEQSAHSILGWLNVGSENNTTDTTPVKGMVVGNVQSGKTANMMACITMAADYGCNLVIVLTGIIDNLRLQTRKRFINDLNAKKSNITFKTLSNPADHKKDENVKKDWVEEFHPEPFTKGINTEKRTCHLCFCLKNSSRLEHLQKLLNHDAQKKSNLRIIIIDDEADQASLNTNKKESKILATINRNIRCIVNNASYDKKTKTFKNYDTPYGSMNYIAFTATPYGNFLNEKDVGSLYPSTFISLLTPSDLYFGPKEIVGLPNVDNTPLPIIQKIPGKHGAKNKIGTLDIGSIERICKKSSDELIMPQSLENALIWFICAVACRRFWKQHSPSTMLIHHSMITEDHLAISETINKWLDIQSKNKNEFIKKCEIQYEQRTSEFSLDSFKKYCKWYGAESYKNRKNKALEDVRNYPSFEEIRSHIIEIISQIGHVNINDDSKLVFNSGIHICTDNCKAESSTDQDPAKVNVRLVYPDDDNPYDGLSPAFIVVGGNTLSRCLTLEGLICTYFSRDVKQADTLMQMGRWFGYRVGYELLPRIWLTTEAQTRFEYLARIDDSLRTDLVTYANSEGKDRKSPLDVAPIITLPVSESLFRVTSKSKMQSATDCDINLAGANIQPTIFNKNDLKKNLDIGNAFISFLEKNQKEEMPYKDNSNITVRRIWKNVDFKIIWEKLLEPSAFNILGISSKDLLKKWIEKVIESGDLTNWNVVLKGKTDSNDGINLWHGVKKIERSRLISGTRDEDSEELNFGTISSSEDWCSDFCSELEEDEIKQLIEAESKAEESEKRNPGIIESAKAKIRNDRELGKTPLLVMYCIDKHSKARNGSNNTSLKIKPYRADLPNDLDSDILAIYIRIPGDKTNKNYTKRITMDMSC